MGTKKQTPEPFCFQPFEGLKKVIESRAKFLPQYRAPEKNAAPPSPDQSQEKLFADAMKDVREIREFRSIPVPGRKPCNLRRKSPPELGETPELQVLEEIVKGRRSVILQHTQEYIEWINPAYRVDILKKLCEGGFSVQDCLDLHGFVLEEAEEELTRFLNDSLKKRLRCIRIIHGRGLRSPNGPVVKEMVVQLLSRRFRKQVIAFVTARQCDGGLGALYVLLR